MCDKSFLPLDCFLKCLVTVTESRPTLLFLDVPVLVRNLHGQLSTIPVMFLFMRMSMLLVAMGIKWDNTYNTYTVTVSPEIILILYASVKR